ncbi:MAG TPA: flagellar biosynthetic protein FliO [Terrimesophilobacter sp.]|nr:flagellar biosynthetic protein FliO [Terrimesophilobacter sp.]
MEPVFLALRVVLSLAVVLGLLWIVQRRLGRKARRNNTGDLVTVVTRRGISQKASVVVVDVDGMRYLLGVTEQSVNVLGTSEAPVRVAGADEFAKSMSAAAIDKADLAVITGRRPSFGGSGVPAAFGGSGARLGGSILSPLVWKQAAHALRQGLSR